MAIILSSKLTVFRERLAEYGRSLRFKLVAAMVLAALIVTLVINTYPIELMERQLMESKQTELMTAAGMIASSVSASERLTAESVNTVLSVLDTRADIRTIVTDETCRVLYDDRETASMYGQKLVVPEVLRTLQGTQVFRCEEMEDALECSLAVPLFQDGALRGVLFIYMQDSAWLSDMRGLQSKIRWLSAVILLVTLFLSVTVSLYFSTRVNRLLLSIRRMKAGVYGDYEEIRENDEIAKLFKEFNDLSGRLAETEERRKQFVSNASHELKTPLASVKLLADSVVQNEDMPMEDVRDFLSDISQEVERLTRITDRLLVLTRLEDQTEVHKSRVNISETVDRAVHMLEPLAALKHIEVKCALSEDAVIYADYDGIYQILFNLLENAYKYNHENGRVNVYTYCKGGLVFCLIDDTGIGIAREDRERIFERFYRVDKARSRQTGGTGLGLSIVKHAVEVNGGEITVERREPEGSRFILSFPAYQNNAPDQTL